MEFAFEAQTLLTRFKQALGLRDSNSGTLLELEKGSCGTRPKDDKIAQMVDSLDDIDFFDLDLTDVTTVKRVGQSVESTPERISVSVSADFACGKRCTAHRVPGR